MKYINIHTHQPPQANETAIQNLYKNFRLVNTEGHYSIGLHPWYITEHWQNDFEQLCIYSAHPHVKAIGECGLDKVCNIDFKIQQNVFIEQIQLANAVKKPLIIHCVKAHEQVLQQLKEVQTPAIFHGFSKSKELALQIIHAGHYLSFGTALLQPRMQEVLKAIPLSKIFLETDDAAETIQRIYGRAAAILSIDEVSLSLQLQKNSAAVFNL